MAELSKQLVDAMKQADERKTSAFDSIGTVRRVKDGIAYVHLAGGVDETPVQLTVDAKAGDEVQVRVSGGRAWIVGNATAPPTDNTMAKQAINYSKIANEAAQRATKDALVANEAAESASESAREAKETTDEINEYAETAGKTITQILNDGETAGTAAQQAKSAADSAMKGLGQVEDVVGVLEWITSHGEMESQAGETFDSTKVYFIIDPNGDYVIGGTHYSLVTNPVAADIDSYYCLSVDRSIQNYVATHIVVDSEGLWIIPDSGGNKVLIATGGAGKRYETAGTYIVDRVGNDDVTLAQFTTDGVQIGRDSETHAEIDYHSLQLIAKGETKPYFWVSDLRDKNGIYHVEESVVFRISDQDPPVINLAVTAIVNDNYIVTVNDVVWVNVEKHDSYIRFPLNDLPPDGSKVGISYDSSASYMKAYTLGTRRENSFVAPFSYAEGYDVSASGAYSHAEGVGTEANGKYSHAEGVGTEANELCSHAEGESTEANGYCSHAEGYYTEASGDYSHAEGYYSWASGRNSHAEGEFSKAIGNYSHAEGESTEANGKYSHSQNRGTVAGYDDQTAIGKFNDNKQNNAFEIGKGEDADHRSNAFEVDWEGRVKCGDNQGTLTALLDLIHPVGSYYWTSDGDFLPEDVFGGKWEKIDAGVTLVSAGTGYTVTQGTAKDGGSADAIVPYHRHSVNEQNTGNMSANSTHNHDFSYAQYNRTSGTSPSSALNYTGSTKTTSTESVQHTHKVPSHNTNYAGTSGNTQGANMPPYKCAYCWHRTA